MRGDEPWHARHWKAEAEVIEGDYEDSESPENALRWETLMRLRNALVKDYYAKRIHEKEPKAY